MSFINHRTKNVTGRDIYFETSTFFKASSFSRFTLKSQGKWQNSIKRMFSPEQYVVSIFFSKLKNRFRVKSGNAVFGVLWWGGLARPPAAPPQNTTPRRRVFCGVEDNTEHASAPGLLMRVLHSPNSRNSSAAV